LYPESAVLIKPLVFAEEVFERCHFPYKRTLLEVAQKESSTTLPYGESLIFGTSWMGGGSVIAVSLNS